MNPNRTPFLTQQRRNALPNITREEKPAADDNLMRFYPLESNSNKGGRATPVNPMQHTSRQQIQPRRSTPSQPGFSMPPPMIPRSNPVPPPPQQELPPSPELAVNQFRRANQGLPDGVRYEPLDEKTMRLLQENGHIPDTTPQAAPRNPMPVAPISPPTPTFESQQKIIDTIQNLIQDERNANIFYSHHAATVEITWIREAIEQIANDSKRHALLLSEILKNHMGNSFTPQEAEINTGLELKTALDLALSEEGKTLRTMIELMDSISIREAEKNIQGMINAKIMNFSHLVRLMQTQ